MENKHEAEVIDKGEALAAETVEEVVENGAENGAEKKPAPAPAPKKLKKHDRAKAKVAEAQQKILSTDEEIEACMKKIDEDLEDFKAVEARFVETTLQPAQKVLTELGAADRVLESVPAPKVDLEDPEVENVEIKKLSSGRLSGLTWGLIGGVVALAGWCYTATQALGLPLLPEKLPDMERLNAALAWTAKQLGQGENVAVGAVIVGGGVLVTVGAIYGIITALRGSKNLKVAEKIEADTEFYCTKKGECKSQMEKVREHIAHAKKTIEKYEVLLGELNARLKRALFIEEADNYDQLHAKTKEDVRKLKKLSHEVERFLETPMAEHGILSKEGVETLEAVNKAANDYVMELYGE